MKNILYHLLFLVFISLISGFVLLGQAGQLELNQALAVSGGLVLYALAMVFVGETKETDQRQSNFKNVSAKTGLTAAIAVLCLGLMYQMLFTNTIDWWLIASLVAINLTKLITLIFLNTNSKSQV
ncbi:MAG: hypothetical protein JNN11_01455 [Candidatus Doudnabacteria bacterium]|nr:hypothetical protein [Candidatus Doudnabacteria bacterium]